MVRHGLLLVLVALGVALPAVAQTSVPDLKRVPPSQRVVAVTYCAGEYRVASEDGTAALAPSGRLGDRAFVVYATLEAMKDAPRRAEDCSVAPPTRP